MATPDRRRIATSLLLAGLLTGAVWLAAHTWRAARVRYGAMTRIWDEPPPHLPKPLPGLSEDEVIFLRYSHDPDDAGAARVLAERFPDSPELYANYIRIATRGIRPAEREAAEQMARIERGKAVDPDNALYHYLEAATLMAASSDTERVKGAPATITVTDTPLFERGLDEFLAGTRKPRCTAHCMFPLRRNVELRQPVRTLPGFLSLAQHLASTRMGHVSGLMAVRRHTAAYAHAMARRGQWERALALTEALRRTGAQIGAGGDTIMEVLAGSATVGAAWKAEAAVHEAMGREQEADTARRAADREDAARRAVYDGPPPTPNYSAEHGGIAEDWAPLSHMAPENGLVPAARRAEHAAGRRWAVLWFVATVATLLAPAAAVALWGLVRHRGLHPPPRVIVPRLRESALLVAAAVGLPVTAYILLAHLPPWAITRYGLPHCMLRAAVEMQILCASACLLSLVLSWRIIRSRCVEEGIPLRPGLGLPRFRFAAWSLLAAAFGVCLFAYFGRWEPSDTDLFRALGSGRLRPVDELGIVVLALAYVPVAGYAVGIGWQMRGLGEGDARRRATMARSLVLLLSIVLVAGGLAGNTLLAASERRNVRILMGPGNATLLDEVEMSVARDLRDRLRRMDEEWRLEHVKEDAPDASE